jgi:REP-associated tyrosine transposase
MCTYERKKHFSDAAIGEAVRAQLLSAAARWDVEIVAYCFMPDHIHLLVEGKSEQADCRKYADAFRRTSGFRFKRERGSRLWQEGYFDRVLREEEATFDVVSYVVLNPVKAGLCADAGAYPFSGSSRYELSQLLTAAEWDPRSLG